MTPCQGSRSCISSTKRTYSPPSVARGCQQRRNACLRESRDAFADIATRPDEGHAAHQIVGHGRDCLDLATGKVQLLNPVGCCLNP